MKNSFIILFYSFILFLLFFITFCEGVKPGEGKSKYVEEKNVDAESGNAAKLMDSLQPHFHQFGAPFQPLEYTNDQIVKRNRGGTAAAEKVEWRLMEVNKYKEIKEWSGELCMLEGKQRQVEKKVLAPAMTDYANCVMKTKKMKNIIKEKKTAKIFLLNGGITILEMKSIVGKRHAFRVKYEAEFSDTGRQILEPSTHFCTALFVVEENSHSSSSNRQQKIDSTELICTKIGEWIDKEGNPKGPPKNIEKRPDCGRAELHDAQLDAAELLKGSGAENLAEFIQIKMALDLQKMIQNFGQQNLEEAAESTNEHGRIQIKDPNICAYKEFLLEYNSKKLVANWLLERLSRENALSKLMPTKRKALKWAADPRVSRLFQPTEKDYKMAKQFKLNHGHLAGFRAHRTIEEETFFYPNSVPQDREINSGYWRVIEEYALCLAGHKQSTVYVYTGPLYIPDEEADKWQMKYKVVGEKRKMSVPTHLFKTIFVEFMAVNEEGVNKKKFWLESLVMPNGEDEEEEEQENVNEQQGERGENYYSEGDESEEFQKIKVEMEESKNVWYILQDEAEIDKILMEGSSPKSQSPKEKGKEKISAGSVKKSDKIEALVYGCQNRHYNIVYGDASSRDTIGQLLKRHRHSLEYIQKYAPQFRLLPKLPSQLRVNTKGVYFDEQRMAELFEKKEKNEKNRKGKAKMLEEEETGAESDRENEEQSPREIHKMSQHGRKLIQKRKGKKNKGGRATKKHHEQKYSSSAADEGIPGFGASHHKNNKTVDIMNRLENTYIEYLFYPPKKTSDDVKEQSRLWDKLHFQLHWISLFSLLQLIKERMSDDNNTQGHAQIDAIQTHLVNVVEGQILPQILAISLTGGDPFYEVGFCWLIHVHESFLRAFLPTPSTSENQYQKMSDGFKKLALETEHRRWARFGLYKNTSFSDAKDEETEYFTNDVDGTIIAEKFMKLADAHCRHEDGDRLTEYLYKFKREIDSLNFVALNYLLSNAESKLAQKYAKLVENISVKKPILLEASFKMMRLLNVKHFKMFMKMLPKYVFIEPTEFNNFHATIFHNAFFDLRLHIGYRQRKHFLIECLLFFDVHKIHKTIVKISNEYSERFSKFTRIAKRNRMREFGAQRKNFYNQLEQCQNVEHQDTMVGQAKVQACIVDLFCQMQNLYSEINANWSELSEKQILGNSPYYNAAECDLMIRRWRGKFFAETLREDPNFSKAFYAEYVQIESENPIKKLFKWAFDIIGMKQGEIVGEDAAEIDWAVSSPLDTSIAYREQTLVQNEKMETFAENIRPYLMSGDPKEWQAVQFAVTLGLIQAELSVLFSEIANIQPKNEEKMDEGNDKGEAIPYKIGEASKLKEIFMKMLTMYKNNNTEVEMCKTLILRKFTVHWVRRAILNNGEKNEKLEQMIEKYERADESTNNLKFPFGEDLQPTMENLNEYCQNMAHRQLLLRKHRVELETLMAAKMNATFYTQALGMFEYKNVMELPAKLIKMAGINGFIRIARNHPLVMTNVFHGETVRAILYQIDIHEQDEEAEKASRKNEQHLDEQKKAEIVEGEKRKLLILLDLILFQFALHVLGEMDDEQKADETPEKIELRFRIERVRSTGAAVMDEWMDNTGVSKEQNNETNENDGGELGNYSAGMTREQQEKAAEKADQKAYLEIGQLIRKNDRVALELGQEGGGRTDPNKIVDGEEIWRKTWRQIKLAELELNGWAEEEEEEGEGHNHGQQKEKNEAENIQNQKEEEVNEGGKGKEKVLKIDEEERKN